MDDYRRHVKELADRSSKDLIPNGGIDHAAVLIENLFSHAISAVRVFTGDLNARVYASEPIVSNAKEFLQSGVGKKIKILVQNPDVARNLNHELLRMCASVGPDLCEVKIANETDQELKSHFVIMDEKGYRFEPDREKPTAIGCFNDKSTAKRLCDAFDAMFARGEGVSLAAQEPNTASEAS